MCIKRFKVIANEKNRSSYSGNPYLITYRKTMFGWSRWSGPFMIGELLPTSYEAWSPKLMSEFIKNIKDAYQGKKTVVAEFTVEI